jgi:NADPH-dependent curcumin reductase
MQNQRILFARIPKGLPVLEDFGGDTVPVAAPGQGQFLVRSIYLSLDPFYRTIMKGGAMYGDPLLPGEVMVGDVVGQVLESRNSSFAVGDYVLLRGGWQQYCLSDGTGVRKLDPRLAPLRTAVGVLGMPGLTGYVGMVYLGEPKPGQTVVVSAATGPVGSTAAQVAKHMGARVVGIAGSAEKCAYAVAELGYSACVNYKQGDLRTLLKSACPSGIDVYFDNVGGATLVAVLANLALQARVVLCGIIEAYSADTPPPGPFLGPVVGARATLKGLVVFDHLARLPEQNRVVGDWIREGSFHYREDVTEGLAQAPAAFCRLMRGENFGKALVRMGPETVK